MYNYEAFRQILQGPFSVTPLTYSAGLQSSVGCDKQNSQILTVVSKWKLTDEKR